MPRAPARSRCTWSAFPRCRSSGSTTRSSATGTGSSRSAARWPRRWRPRARRSSSAAPSRRACAWSPRPRICRVCWAASATCWPRCSSSRASTSSPARGARACATRARTSRGSSSASTARRERSASGAGRAARRSGATRLIRRCAPVACGSSPARDDARPPPRRRRRRARPDHQGGRARPPSSRPSARAGRALALAHARDEPRPRLRAARDDRAGVALGRGRALDRRAARAGARRAARAAHGRRGGRRRHRPDLRRRRRQPDRPRALRRRRRLRRRALARLALAGVQRGGLHDQHRRRAARAAAAARAARCEPMMLAGLRVIDAASFIAGPVATTILADLGADVIKLEPPAGDPYRHRTGGPGVPESPYNYRWIVDNRTKRGLALDLRAAEGRAVLHRLVERADVFVTNTPLDSRARLGIRWEDLAPLNARLVYASITAYGERGEEAPRSGFDSTALWARTGLMDLVRPSPDSPPSRSLPGMGDHPTGVTLFAAIMTALYQREKTGKGTMVATSLMANGLWWNAIQVQAAPSGARVEPRPSREEPATALANLYRCRDGRWFLLNVLNDERDWPTLLRAIERSALAGRRRQGTATPGPGHRRALGRDPARGGLRRGPDQRPARVTRGAAILAGVDLKRLTVDASTAGARRDRWLAERMPELSSARAQALIDDGRVRVDGRARKPSHRVTRGERIEVEI